MVLNGRDDFAEKIILDCLDFSEGYLTYNKVFALGFYIIMLKK